MSYAGIYKFILFKILLVYLQLFIGFRSPSLHQTLVVLGTMQRSISRYLYDDSVLY